MGLFTTAQKDIANSVYEKAKKYIEKKDGNIHILMINSFSKLANQLFECDDKYTTQLNTIITGLQNDGYKIIDIKFNSLMNQGITGQTEGFHTLIMYQ